jgi:hypothetical protein
LKCGSYLNVIVDLENLGDSDEDVVIKVDNEALGIHEQSEEFELEAFGDDDSISKELLIQIPMTATAGKYNLATTIEYGGEKEIVNQDIVLDNCVNQIGFQELGVKSSDGEVHLTQQDSKSDTSKKTPKMNTTPVTIDLGFMKWIQQTGNALFLITFFAGLAIICFVLILIRVKS